MSYEPTKYAGEPKHCCLAMDYALDEHYLESTLQFTTTGIKVLNPHIEGPKLTEHGRKRKNSLLVTYCPWCGKRLAELDSSEAS